MFPAPPIFRYCRLSEAGARQLGLEPGAPAHECVIELLTGRTHQIRAQLSAVGCPLLGDGIYQPLASPELRQVGTATCLQPLGCKSGQPFTHAGCHPHLAARQVARTPGNLPSCCSLPHTTTCPLPPSITTHYHQTMTPPTCPITTLLQRLFEGDSCEELWPEGGRLLEEPTGGIGLQACRLEVAAAFMGGSPEAPAVFEAGTPWWRA